MRAPTQHRSGGSIRGRAFTIVELLVSMVVLVLLIGLIVQLFNQAVAVTTLGTKRADADTQARVLLERIGADLNQMVRRADVDYYLKGRPESNKQSGNDQIAFFSEVPGYYPSTGVASPLSLVAYRVNNQLGEIGVERLGKGLVWNGVSATDTPIVFLPAPIADALPSPLPSPMPAAAPTPAWPQAGNMDKDDDYELAGPQVFRFEYYYLLKGQKADPVVPSILSEVPWDTRPPASHVSVNGLADVAAIGVAIAVVDPKSRGIISDVQLTNLTSKMKDFDPASMPAIGKLEAQWNSVVSTSGLPPAAASAVRVYGRCFYLSSSAQ